MNSTSQGQHPHVASARKASFVGKSPTLAVGAMAGLKEVLFLAFLALILNFCKCDNPHRKFEYKYSFKGPYLAQKDGTVPFWEYDGNAIASEEMVRITPSLRSKKGAIWTRSKTTFQWWEVELIFRVSGRGRLGADGLAFWFTEEKGVEGPVFGSSEPWKGLGIFFDSFDNDGRGNNPYILAMNNDGTKTYDHQTDGVNQQLAGCLRDFRNKPYPVRAKIEYYKNVLSVLFHGGNTNNDDDYEMCIRVENVFLPASGHFGVSAATGGLADDHDALKFLTFSLYPPGTEPAAHLIADAEKEKLSKEYEQYKDKLEKQKEEYKKQHPGDANRPEYNPEEEYESQQQRELSQIFNGQSQMFEAVKALHRKLDEIVGRQERTLSMLSAVQLGGGGGGMPQGQMPPVGHQPNIAGGVIGDTIRRHEVEAVLGNQKELVQATRDVKAFVADIHQRTGTIITNQNKVGSAGPGDGGINQNTINEIKDNLHMVKREVASLVARPVSGGAMGCPPVQAPNCLTPTYFFVFMGIQLTVFIGYIIFKSNKEAKAKKFY